MKKYIIYYFHFVYIWLQIKFIVCNVYTLIPFGRMILKALMTLRVWYEYIEVFIQGVTPKNEEYALDFQYVWV